MTQTGMHISTVCPPQPTSVAVAGAARPVKATSPKIKAAELVRTRVLEPAPALVVLKVRTTRADEAAGCEGVEFL